MFLQKIHKLTQLLKNFRQFSNNSQIPLSLPSFNNYIKNADIKKQLEELQILTPTPVQDLAIPEIIKEKHNNYYIAAQTGTGKTITYLLPILQKLKELEIQSGTINTKPNRPMAIIIVPTKELVEQVVKMAKNFSRVVKLKVIGLNNFDTIAQQKKELDQGVDIIIGTLDRIEKHKMRNNLFYSNLLYYVVDEVDTFMDSGYKDILKAQIESFQIKNEERKKTNQQKATMIFVGATYTGPLDQLFMECFGSKKMDTDQNLKKLIDKKTHTNLSNLYHEFIHITQLDKHIPMIKLMKEQFKEMKKIKGSMMIFCNSISSCQSLEYLLQENDFNSVCLHGDVPKKAREQNFNRFLRRDVDILISTDLGSRGLDFPFLTHVINFDFPQTTSDYLHRAGRAGRAERKGFVFSIYHLKDKKIIDELKVAHETGNPLQIKGSSYSMINKEILVRQKQLQKQGEKQLDQEFVKQKEIHKQLSKGTNLPQSYVQFKDQWEKDKQKHSRNYIPEKDRDEIRLKQIENKRKKTKKYVRNRYQTQFNQEKHQAKQLRRKITRKKQETLK